MDDGVIRIMISTDTHLGYMEKDSVRCDDSFAAFEEVLIKAKAQSADFVLLAGDVFHENKPSRRTLHSTMDILTKYTYGENPIYIELMNDESDIFQKHTRVNYEDPYRAISLPVFSIHGNHDDPTRDSGHESLAAMDLLSITKLVNYFGKCNEVDNIEITPILLRKQNTVVALYGLGAIRDERLNRMWNQKKVKFVRPTEEQGRDNFFNIFVIHQNRDYGRGSKNCIHESMIPEWMDVVIWGNEHECQPRLCESLVGTFRIYQPGSSVATSLVEGESISVPKHMGLLEIRNKQFRLHTTRFTQNRIFIYEDISLSAIESLQPHDPKIEEKIHKVLVDKVEKMLTEAKQVHTTQLTTTTDDDGQVETAPLYRIRSPDQYLIRLRVEHSGYPSLNQNRFGANFVGRIANPSEMLLFSKKKKEYQPRAVEGKAHRERKQQQDVDDGEEDEGIHKIKIDDLVCESLRNSKRPLSLLVEASLTQALDEFILKKDSGSIPDLVEETLNNTRKVLFGEVLADTKDKIIEYVSRHKKTTEDSIARGEAAAVPRRAPRPYDDDDDEDNEDEGDETKVKPKATAAKGGAKTKAVPAPKPKAKPRKKTEDSDDESVEKKAPKRRRAAKKPADEYEFNDDDDEVVYVSSGSGAESPFDDDDDEPPAKKKKVATSSKSKPAAGSKAVAAKPPARAVPAPKVMETKVPAKAVELPFGTAATSQATGTKKQRQLPLNLSGSASASQSSVKKASLTSNWE